MEFHEHACETEFRATETTVNYCSLFAIENATVKIRHTDYFRRENIPLANKCSVRKINKKIQRNNGNNSTVTKLVRTGFDIDFQCTPRDNRSPLNL